MTAKIQIVKNVVEIRGSTNASTIITLRLGSCLMLAPEVSITLEPCNELTIELWAFFSRSFDPSAIASMMFLSIESAGDRLSLSAVSVTDWVTCRWWSPLAMLLFL